MSELENIVTLGIAAAALVVWLVMLGVRRKSDELGRIFKAHSLWVVCGGLLFFAQFLRQTGTVEIPSVLMGFLGVMVFALVFLGIVVHVVLALRSVG